MTTEERLERLETAMTGVLEAMPNIVQNLTTLHEVDQSTIEAIRVLQKMVELKR